MKSIVRKIAFACMGMLLLTGCGNSTKDTFTTADQFPITEQTGNIRMVTPVEGIFSPQLSAAPTEEGFYSITQLKAGTVNITYTDYEEQKCIYLCNQPGCQHTDEACTSFIPYAVGGSTVFASDQYLYYLQYGSRSSEMPDKNRAHLIRMNLDGSEHKLIHTFDASQDPLNGLAFDGQYLYFILRTWDSKVDSETRQLVMMDVDSGKMRAIAQYGDKSYAKEDPWILGASGHTLYVQVSHLDQAGNTTGLAGAEADYNNTLVDLYAIHVDTNDIEKLDTWNLPDRRIRFDGENAYYLDFTDHSLKELNTDTCETRTLNADLGIHTISDAEILYIHDQKVIVSAFNEDGSNHQIFAVDINTGEASPLTLTYTTVEGEKVLVPIELENEDNFIVRYKEVMQSSHFVEADGTIVDQQEMWPLYALIAKEDYWNNRPNYQPIAPLENSFAA